MGHKDTLCLWYDKDAPGDFPSGKAGDVLTVDFTVCGVPCMGLNGGPAFKHSEAFSFQIATDDQAETERLVQGQMGLVVADHAPRAD